MTLITIPNVTESEKDLGGKGALEVSSLSEQQRQVTQDLATQVLNIFKAVGYSCSGHILDCSQGKNF